MPETTTDPAAAASGTLIPVVRFIYRGESLRNGRVCRLAVDDLNAAEPHVAGELLLQAMRSEDANLDLARFAPFVYSQELEGWVALRPETEVPLRWAEPAASTAGARVLRAEVMLEVKQAATPARERDLSVTAALASAASVAVATVGGAASAGAAEAAAEGAAEATAEGTASAGAAEGEGASDAGFFAVGVYNSKSADNVGTLWRSAFQLGAAYIFTIGARNAWEKTADTYRSWRRIPAFRFADWGSFCAASPYSTVWVAVEMGGVPLADFEHPERCEPSLLGVVEQGLAATLRRPGPGCNPACPGCNPTHAPQVRRYLSIPGASTCWGRRTRACRPPWCAPARIASRSSARARRASMWPWREASSCTTGCASAPSTRRGWAGTSEGSGDSKQRRQRPDCGDTDSWVFPKSRK